MDENAHGSDGGSQPKAAPSDVCLEKKRLLEVWQHATRAHAEAVMALKQIIGTCTKEEYEMLYRATEALRTRAEDAEDKLDRHALRHGC
jgi:hypothetical protein